MKTLPAIHGSRRELRECVQGSVRCTVLITAIRFRIFDALTVPASADTVARKLRLHPRNTELFLNALAGMGMIHKQDGRFFNTAVGGECLVSSAPAYLGSFLLHVHAWHQNLDASLEGLLRDGPPGEMALNLADGDLWAESARLSAAYQLSGAAQQIVQIARSQPDFPAWTKMLDLGGGAGLFTVAIVSSHPTLNGVVFEQPPVAEVARGFIQAYDAQDRVDIMEGDYAEDSIGSGYDLVFASATLNFVKDRLDEIVKKVHDALKPGGLFLTHQDGFTHERSRPVQHAVEFLSAELYGMDFAFPQGMIAECMLRCGFRSVRSKTLTTYFGDMDVDLARK